MRPNIWLVAASLLMAAAVPAAAQSSDSHDRFWIGFGLGAGKTSGSNSLAGGAAYLRLGGSPSQMLLVGGELIAWARSQNNVTLSRGNATADILFYPSLSGGFFLKTGLGFANVSAQSSSGNTTVTTTDQGFGSTFGAGYDIKIGRNLYVTPNVDVLVQVINSTTNAVYLASLGLTWH